MRRDANGAVRPVGEDWSYQVVYWGTLPEDRNTAVLSLNYQDGIAPETHYRVPRSLLPPASDPLHTGLVDDPNAPVPLSLEVDLTNRSSGEGRIKGVRVHFPWWEDEEDFYEMTSEELEDQYVEPRKASDLRDVRSYAEFVALLDGDAADAQDELNTVKSFTLAAAKARGTGSTADAGKASRPVTGEGGRATVHQLHRRPPADKPVL